MTNTFKNFKVKDIQVGTNNQYVLVVNEPSLLDPNGITRHITLWSRRDGQIDERSVELTQNNLRRELNNADIIFTDPSQKTTDPNHIENWVANNVNVELENVYLTKSGYFTISKPGGESNGKSRQYHPYRRVYKGEGIFDPNTQYLSFRDAFEESEIFEFIEGLQPVDENQGLGASIVKSKNYVGLKFSGKVVDVNYDAGNARNIPKVDDAPTRKDVLERVLKTLNQITDDDGNHDTEIIEKVKALPENYAWAELIDILGGYDCAYVTIENARMLLSKYLETLVKWSLVVYVQPDGLEGIIRPTRLKTPWYSTILPTDPKGALKKEYKRQELSFEYLHGDFSNRDFLVFLEKAKANVTGIIQPVLQKMGYITEGGLKELDPQEVLQVLLQVIKHGNVRANLSATLANSKGPADLAKLGITPTHIFFESVNVDAVQSLDEQSSADNVDIVLPGNMTATSPVQEVIVTQQPQAQQESVFAALPSADQFDDDLPF